MNIRPEQLLYELGYKHGNMEVLTNNCEDMDFLNECISYFGE